jgi:hypothetical protein
MKIYSAGDITFMVSGLSSYRRRMRRPSPHGLMNSYPANQNKTPHVILEFFTTKTGIMA